MSAIGGFFGFTTRAGSIYGGNGSQFHDSNHAQHLQNLRDLQLRKIMGWFLFQRKSTKICQGVCLSLFVYSFSCCFFSISHAVHGLFLVRLGWRWDKLVRLQRPAWKFSWSMGAWHTKLPSRPRFSKLAKTTSPWDSAGHNRKIGRFVDFFRCPRIECFHPSNMLFIFFAWFRCQ